MHTGIIILGWVAIIGIVIAGLIASGILTIQIDIDLDDSNYKPKNNSKKKD